MINEQDVKELASKLEDVKGESSKILDNVLSEDYVADDKVKIIACGSGIPSSGLTILEDAPEVTSLEEEDIDFNGSGHIAAYQIKHLKDKMIKAFIDLCHRKPLPFS